MPTAKENSISSLLQGPNPKHLLKFDSVHGTWETGIEGREGSIFINGKEIAYTQNTQIYSTNWSGCHLVIEASGQVKTKALLQACLD